MADNEVSREFKVTLVGAGNMGGAMVKGWLAAGISPANLTALDPAPSAAIASFLNEAGVNCHSNAKDCPVPDVIVVAVKPQVMGSVLPGLASLVGPETVVVSVAAGTRIAQLAEHYADPAVVRAMPNTPALVMRGITVGCPNAKVSTTQCGQVDFLLRANGEVEWIDDEELMDAVTAVSGSGPAYAFFLAECMAEAGIKAGLPEALAQKLARYTVSGAGELMHQASEPPSVLRENVTSPGGTTAAALSVLMAEDGMKPLFEHAIRAARDRGRELS